jgi:hypothetical protein
MPSTACNGFFLKLPQANTAVANNISHGTRPAKKIGGVLSNNIAPNNPPARLMTNKWTKPSRPTLPASLRLAAAAVIWLGNSAIVDMTLAASGFSPANSSAGKVMKEPPLPICFAHRHRIRRRRSTESSGILPRYAAS